MLIELLERRVERNGEFVPECGCILDIDDEDNDDFRDE